MIDTRRQSRMSIGENKETLITSLIRPYSSILNIFRKFKN